MIMTRWQWIAHQLSRRLVLRAALISLLSLASAVAAIVIKPYLPADISFKVGAEAVDSILAIIASSMLAVITFSLSTVVQAYASATNTATPRAISLLQDDTAVQNMLSTFIGAFIFSLAGIILLKTGIYGEEGRVVLFVFTIAVLIILVMTLLRWIDYLLSFGRLGEVISRVEEASCKAMVMRRDQPFLGGIELVDPDAEMEATSFLVETDRIAHVQHVDMKALQKAAGKERHIHLLVLPGTYVHPGRPLARVSGMPDDEISKAVRQAVTLGSERSFRQDPRFGLIAMAEIASRALSPAVNDPGTAVQIISRAVNVLAIWSRGGGDREVLFDRVHVPALKLEDLFDDFFLPVGRDGASMAEVQLRILRALVALKALGEREGDERYVEAVKREAQVVLDRGSGALKGSPLLDNVIGEARALVSG